MTVEITENDCTPDGNGTDATLSVEFTVLVTDNDSIDSVAVKVNGNASATLPTEKAGSPTTPSAGNKLHTYEWSESVMCDASYSLQAVAVVTTTATDTSGTVNQNCPCT